MYSFSRVQSQQVIIDSFKHCTLTIPMDGSEDLLIHCFKSNQPCAAGVHWVQKLYYAVLQETQDPSETSEGLTLSDRNLGKNKISAPLLPTSARVYFYL